MNSNYLYDINTFANKLEQVSLNVAKAFPCVFHSFVKIDSVSSIFVLSSTCKNFLLETGLDLTSITECLYGEEDIGKFTKLIWSRLLAGIVEEGNGWFWLLFSCRLILRGIQSEFPIPVLINGYNHATSSLLDSIKPQNNREEQEKESKNMPKLHLPMSDVKNFLCVIKTTLCQCSSVFAMMKEQKRHQISITIFDAFLASIDDSSIERKFHPYFVYKHITGYQADEITSIKGSVVMDIPLPFQFPRNGLSKITVVLFDCSLEAFGSFSDKCEVEIVSQEENKNHHHVSVESLKNSEFDVMRGWRNILKQSNVKVVICQRRIHPFLQRILADEGIYCLPRVSIRFFNALQGLTGAKALGSMPSKCKMNEKATDGIPPGNLGYLGRLYCKRLYNHKYIIAKSSSHSDDFEEENFGENDKKNYNDNNKASTISERETSDILAAFNNSDFLFGVTTRRRRIVTILVIAPIPSLCEEIQNAFESAINQITSLLEQPYCLPGYGIWQYKLAEVNIKMHQQNDGRNENDVDRKTINMNESNFYDQHGSTSVRSAMKIYFEVLKSCSQYKGNNNTPSNSFSSTLPKFEISHEKYSYSYDDDDDDDDKNGNQVLENQTLHAKALDPLITTQKCLKSIIEFVSCILEVDGEMYLFPNLSESYS